MNNDFSKHIQIIEYFRGQVSKSDFEAQFAVKSKHLPKTERFLLKMELKRLAGPCTRLVDLRGHVDGECRLYEHDGRSHFLDEIAIRVFEDNVEHYGSYTFGVYEAVKNTENNFRVIYQKEKLGTANSTVASEANARPLEKTQYPAKLFTFGPYFNRIEERMNFAIRIIVTLDGGKIVEATSSDISANGCKFRFNSLEQVKLGDIITIRFVGLEQEFQFGSQDSFDYRIQNIHNADNVQLIGCARVSDDEGAKDGFKQFLTGFIQGNKRRYKINLDNSIAAIQSRSYEQFVLPKSNELPIAIADIGGILQPKYALTCNNNQSTFQYWQDENRASTLAFLLTPERLRRLRKSVTLGKSLLVYSFIYKKQGKSFFYTADNMQLLEDKDFMAKYLGFAASKSSFSITTLSMVEASSEYAVSPLTLSESLTKKDRHLNLPLEKSVIDILHDITDVVIACDITDDRLVEQYQKLSYSDIDTAKLKGFGHKRLVSPHVVSELGINFRNHRREPRFKYKTPIFVECGGLKWLGSTVDFSASGLKLELEKLTVLNKGDIVHISFPNLQKVTSSFDLSGLPYEVLRINKRKTIVSLRVYVEQHQHIGRAFFKLLIEKNRNKLTSDENEMINPGLAKALRNVYSRSTPITSLLVQTSGSRYKIETIATGKADSNLLALMRQFSERRDLYNLYPLLSNLKATSLMTSTLKQQHVNDAPVTDIIYIAINPESELVDNAITTKLESELGSTKLKRMFIRNALKRGFFFCIEARLSRTSEPDMDYLNPELSYIGSYAIHRGKQIEQDIWSVAGVIGLYDITEEAMIRYKFVPET